MVAFYERKCAKTRKTRCRQDFFMKKNALRRCVCVCVCVWMFITDSGDQTQTCNKMSHWFNDYKRRGLPSIVLLQWIFLITYILDVLEYFVVTKQNCKFSFWDPENHQHQLVETLTQNHPNSFNYIRCVPLFDLLSKSSCVASEGLSDTRLDFLPCMHQTAQTETDNTEDSRRGDGTVLTLIETMRTALRLTFHLTATLQLEPRPWQRLMRRQRDVDVTSRRNVSVDALFHLRITPFARC